MNPTHLIPPNTLPPLSSAIKKSSWPQSPNLILSTRMATTTPNLHAILFSSPPPRRRHHSASASATLIAPNPHLRLVSRAPLRRIACKATEISKGVEEGEPKAEVRDGWDTSWVPVVPLEALPRGERRVIIQDGDTILLLWYKDEVFAIENRSPAEGAYSEGLLNAKLTQDGCIVCPTTDSTFDLRTGAIKDWYPKNPLLRVLTPPLRTLLIYPVKIEGDNICISLRRGVNSGGSAEIVFSGKAQPGVTASDVNVEEVRMVVDEELQGFGFTGQNELINGKAAIIGFLLLIDFELLTGKGLLKGTGFLDFIYATSKAFGSF